MTDDSDLDGLDPYDLMDAEAARIDRFLAGVSGAAWDAPSRCEGWSVRDVVAHLAASEDYNRACLDGTVGEFLQTLGERGATDLTTANELGVRDFDGRAPSDVIAAWRAKNEQHRRELRARDGGDIDSSVGAYPARWQAFHLAFELAVHADDIAVPVARDEEPGRTAWQARFGRFAIKELKPDATVEGTDGRTRVVGDGVDVELPDAEFVPAVAGRADARATLDDPARAYLRAT